MPALATARLVGGEPASSSGVVGRLRLPGDDAVLDVDVPGAAAGAVDAVRAAHHVVVLPAVAVELLPAPLVGIDDVLDPAHSRRLPRTAHLAEHGLPDAPQSSPPRPRPKGRGRRRIRPRRRVPEPRLFPQASASSRLLREKPPGRAAQRRWAGADERSGPWSEKEGRRGAGRARPPRTWQRRR